MGPNYANLFVGFVEKQIFEQYTDPIPDYFDRYIDDYFATASYSLVELECFINTLLITPPPPPPPANHTKRSIPFSQCLRRICSEDEDFQAKSLEKRHFFVQRSYPTCMYLLPSHLLHLMLYVGETGRSLKTMFGDHQSLAMMLTSLLPDTLIVAITVFQICKF